MVSCLRAVENSGRALGAWLLDAFFPLSCITCHATGDVLCLSCRGQLVARPARKQIVGIPTVIAWYPYSDPCVRTLMRQWKYHAWRCASPVISTLWMQLMAQHPGLLWYEEVWVVPIPASALRKRQRGFVPTQVCASACAAALPSATVQSLLQRRGWRRAQAKIKKEKRSENIRGVFRSEKNADATSRPIILVDDVVTSGATLAEAARVLSENGYTILGAYALCYGE